MKVRAISRVEKELKTVGDMVRVLLFVPKDYSLHPTGKKCSLTVNNAKKCIALNDGGNEIHNLIIDTIADSNEDVERNESELSTVASEFNIVVGYDTDGHASVLGLFSTKEGADQCGKEHIKCGNIEHYEIETPMLDEFGYK